MATYVFSDLHGHLNLYEQIKEYIKPEDTLYCLGDCGDRGPQPWETIKAVAKDPQIIYLKGNHEDMLVKAAKESLAMDEWPSSEYQRLLAINGGMETLEGLLQEENREDWINYLHCLPVSTYYTNTEGQKIFLCHAGVSFWADDPDVLPTARELMWDRLHYYDSAKVLAPTIVVHGHTPIKHICMDLTLPLEVGALRYADGKKYCIDAGTYRTGQAILFNLDSFESIVFKLKD